MIRLLIFLCVCVAAAVTGERIGSEALKTFGGLAGGGCLVVIGAEHKRRSLSWRVVTTKDAGSRDWTPRAVASRKWGVLGTVVGRSDSHGFVLHVRHDDGSEAWYETRELADVT